VAKVSEADMEAFSVLRTFLFLEKRRSIRPRETELNPLEKGKSFSRTRHKP
jgi:hypothetical protein